MTWLYPQRLCIQTGSDLLRVRPFTHFWGGHSSIHHTLHDHKAPANNFVSLIQTERPIFPVYLKAKECFLYTPKLFFFTSLAKRPCITLLIFITAKENGPWWLSLCTVSFKTQLISKHAKEHGYHNSTEKEQKDNNVDELLSQNCLLCAVSGFQLSWFVSVFLPVSYLILNHLFNILNFF